ncbi:hypothetical protein NDU88_001827 [Pleurodeles waltl]|uniref:LINE-1 type transposase domain-containing protein 1 n=1 Tax=Pleurodeles waltl TaxID=8319 RepID=A0AAV7SAY3_PLEWA|nr:hypothetical protein NDU88_001827 [Pleurodeles waltl]
MGKDRENKQPPAFQQKIDKFTTPAGPRRDGETANRGPALDGVSAILQAIQSSQSAVETRIGEVREDMGLIRQDLRNAVRRITEVEGRVSQTEDELADLRTKVAQLQTRTSKLQRRAEDAENRSRRNNLRFVGFPEGAEEDKASEFLERWIKTWIPDQTLSPWFAVERAHRALAPCPPPGGPRRPMIACFFNFKDRDNILKEARRSEDLQWENHKILIFTDYTREVQTRRRSYQQVKQKLRAMQLSYMLLFPAWLKVIMAGRAHFFESPEEAWDWLTEEGIEAQKGPLKQGGGEPSREGPHPFGRIPEEPETHQISEREAKGPRHSHRRGNSWTPWLPDGGNLR